MLYSGLAKEFCNLRWVSYVPTVLIVARLWVIFNEVTISYGQLCANIWKQQKQRRRTYQNQHIKKQLSINLEQLTQISLNSNMATNKVNLSYPYQIICIQPPHNSRFGNPPMSVTTNEHRRVSSVFSLYWISVHFFRHTGVSWKFLFKIANSNSEKFTDS